MLPKYREFLSPHKLWHQFRLRTIFHEKHQPLWPNLNKQKSSWKHQPEIFDWDTAQTYASEPSRKNFLIRCEWSKNVSVQTSSGKVWEVCLLSQGVKIYSVSLWGTAVAILYDVPDIPETFPLAVSLLVPSILKRLSIWSLRSLVIFLLY